MESYWSQLVSILVSVSFTATVLASPIVNAVDISPETVIRPELRERSEALCQELAKEPYFEPEMVIGAPWRVVYMWNMQLEDTCIDMKFKIATPMMIRKFYYDMHEYLEEQPAWGAASLLLSMGATGRKMLLFDQGLAGRFAAVANVRRDGAIMGPATREVPLLHFQMKLVQLGKYLIFMDCHVGLASIAVRYDQPPNREEINQIAEKYADSFGDGYHACLAEKVFN